MNDGENFYERYGILVKKISVGEWISQLFHSQRTLAWLIYISIICILIP